MKFFNCQPLQFILIFLGFYAVPVISFSQASGVLDSYVKQGLENNHTLKEQSLQLEKNRLSLEEAKRLYWPEINFGATYTLAHGGRDIDFPVGDLLNPVYSTLNDLTEPGRFPMLENQKINFLPNNFYDARFRISQPIFQPAIPANKRIAEGFIDIKSLEIDVQKRELVKEIKIAYFHYLQAREAIKIYDNALDLLAESQRVNRSLLNNDKIIPSVLTRTQADIAATTAQKNEAYLQMLNAGRLFNFLINRPLDSIIETDSFFLRKEVALGTDSLQQREELVLLEMGVELRNRAIYLEKTRRLPTLGAQLDLGSQAFGLDWGGYVLLGVQLEIPVWTAGRNNLKIQQAEVDLMATREKQKEVAEQVDLQVQMAEDQFRTSVEVWRSYADQIEGMRSYYDDIFRRYKEGLATYIELLDARTQLTTAETRQVIAWYDTWIKLAGLERAVASYNFQN